MSELEAARSVERVTGQRLEPFDKCVECGDFHDKSTPTNGRYDFHQEENGALEVTFATSRVAERNERDWAPYITSQPAPGLLAHWHLLVDSTAKVKAPRRKREARDSKSFLDVVGPALAELERRGESEVSMGNSCLDNPFHDPYCPYGALRRAGVKSAWSKLTDGGAGSVGASVLFGYDAMPSFDEEDERKKEEKRKKKQHAQDGKKDVSESVKADASHLGPVQWSFGPGFLAHLEVRRADDEQREADFLRALVADQLAESEIEDRARKVVDEKIALARTITWREQLPSLPRPRNADAGTDLIDLLEVEFSLHPDLAAKLLRAHPSRARREVFFWLTWMRSPAWCRLARNGLDRAPKLPDGVTGVWVGCLTDHTQVLHWDGQKGWTRHGLAGSMLTSICRK
ncbi:hypothetical protein [Streptomyces sp. NPDC088182]|uniref:hypothetical protein n=1 Tax=Streptomyces sp. NPDC088182 TaxID=3365838 RepID=UPI003819E865